MQYLYKLVTETCNRSLAIENTNTLFFVAFSPKHPLVGTKTGNIPTYFHLPLKRFHTILFTINPEF